MEAYVQSAIDVISQHSEWAGLVLFLVAFGESLVFLSLVVPGTTILIAAGALVPSGALDLPTVLIWGALGAIIGDAVSFWLGGHFRQSIPSW